LSIQAKEEVFKMDKLSMRQKLLEMMMDLFSGMGEEEPEAAPEAPLEAEGEALPEALGIKKELDA
jgi:hypothetical protein